MINCFTRDAALTKEATITLWSRSVQHSEKNQLHVHTMITVQNSAGKHPAIQVKQKSMHTKCIFA